MPKTLTFFALLAALTSCTPIKPVVSDIGTDKVRIQHIPLLGDPTFQQALKTEDPQSELNLQNEADRACGIYGRIATQPISTRCVEHDYYMGIRVGCLTEETLFACGPADGQD